MICPFCNVNEIEEFETVYYSDKENTGLWEEPAEDRVPIVIREPKGISCEQCKPWVAMYMRLTADELISQQQKLDDIVGDTLSEPR